MKTILIVEDEFDYRNVLQLRLEMEGYAVLAAQNGVEALDIFQKNADNIDLILLDLFMPIKDGESLCTDMRKSLKMNNIPVIVLSNFNNKKINCNVKEYIVKSNINLDDLMQRVKVHTT